MNTNIASYNEMLKDGWTAIEIDGVDYLKKDNDNDGTFFLLHYNHKNPAAYFPYHLIEDLEFMLGEPYRIHIDYATNGVMTLEFYQKEAA